MIVLEENISSCNHYFSLLFFFLTFLDPFPVGVIWRRLRRGSSSDYGQHNTDRLRRVHIMNLDGRLLGGRRDDVAQIDDLKFGRLMLRLLFPSTTWKILPVNCLGQVLPFIFHSKTRQTFRVFLLFRLVIQHLMELTLNGKNSLMQR